ncbi:MAG: lipid-A-disaccharide synthase [Terriglobia bacterium]
MQSNGEFNLLMVAGERSGDLYGGRLAACLKARLPAMEIFGCGGDMMRQGGVDTIVDSQQFAMVGITEVISGLPRAWRALNRLVNAARERQPRLAVLIDSPSLNMRLAKRLKRLGIPVLYFISPQIWAWKKWRLRQLPSLVDRMVCIFDFEEGIYRRAGILVDYVGHPLVDTVRPRVSREEFFSQAGLDPYTRTVALLPGSREIEVAYILPTLVEAAARLWEGRKIQCIIAVAPALNVSRMEERVRRGRPAKLKLVANATYDALAYSDVAVVASGTATVEAALLERPMVVVYRVSPITAFFARWMVSVPFYSMVNILAGHQVVEELIQGDFTPSRVVASVEELLDHPSTALKTELRNVKQRLGTGGAIERAAEVVERMVLEPGVSAPPDIADATALGDN